METPTRILCVMDSAKSSADALRYAIAKAKQQHAKLTIARVFSTSTDDEQPPGTAAIGATSRHDLRASWLPASNIDVEVACQELHPQGEPADDIVDLARELSVDHIVIGTSGRRRPKHLEIGGTARRVLNDAPCAVTVVNNEDVPQ